MKTLIQYIKEDKFVGDSDFAIYSRLAQHKFNHKSKNRQDIIKKEYPGIPDNREVLIKWFKESNGKLVPNELEVIKRENWNQLEQIGEIESSLMSPDKWTYFDYICKNPKKNNKIITIFECSNSKPYCQDPVKQHYFNKYRSFSDFACGAYGIVPEEYSMLYPVREDEWSHSDESESVALKYNIISANRGLDYLKSQGYEKIIVFFQNFAPEEFLHWLEVDPEIKDKLLYVVTPQHRSNMKKTYPQLENGLLTWRIINLKETQERYKNLLKSCLKGSDLERFKELEEILKKDSKSELDDWCEETNKKFNIEPYRTDKPQENKLKRSQITFHTRTSDLDEKIISEFESWLKDWAKTQNDKNITEKTKFGKERLLFSPLDLLIDKYELGEDNPLLKDIDKLYWNMMKAIENVAKSIGVERLNKDKYGRYDYLWIFKKVYDVKNKKEMIKYSDDIGYSQFYQNVKER